MNFQFKIKQEFSLNLKFVDLFIYFESESKKLDEAVKMIFHFLQHMSELVRLQIKSSMK